MRLLCFQAAWMCLAVCLSAPVAAQVASYNTVNSVLTLPSVKVGAETYSQPQLGHDAQAGRPAQQELLRMHDSVFRPNACAFAERGVVPVGLLTTRSVSAASGRAATRR